MGVRNVLAVLLVALLLSIKSDAQQAPQIAYMSLPGTISGVTICDEQNNPLILLDWKMQGDSSMTAFVLIHEMVHVDQMRHYKNGGCKAVQARYRIDPEFRFEVEWGGYCSQARFLVQSGHAKQAEMEVLLANQMMMMYPTHLSVPQVLARAQSCLNHGIPPLTG